MKATESERENDEPFKKGNLSGWRSDRIHVVLQLLLTVSPLLDTAGRPGMRLAGEGSAHLRAEPHRSYISVRSLRDRHLLFARDPSCWCSSKARPKTTYAPQVDTKPEFEVRTQCSSFSTSTPQPHISRCTPPHPPRGRPATNAAPRSRSWRKGAVPESTTRSTS